LNLPATGGLPFGTVCKHQRGEDSHPSGAMFSGHALA
jgi:hypothetical protein